jgi:hypothetical protein
MVRALTSRCKPLLSGQKQQISQHGALQSHVQLGRNYKDLTEIPRMPIMHTVNSESLAINSDEFPQMQFTTS